MSVAEVVLALSWFLFVTAWRIAMAVCCIAFTVIVSREIINDFRWR